MAEKPLSTRRQKLIEIADQARQVAEKLGHDQESHLLLREANRLSRQVARVCLLGEFSRGKSSLINALIGETVLPAKLRPTTSTPVRVRHGPAKRVVGVPATGESRDLALDELDQLNIGKPLASAFASVEVQHPASFLGAGIELVDTPGVNDLAETREDVVLGLLPESDAVLFVLDAKHCLTDSERRFLNRALAQRLGDRLAFVINKCDQLDPSFDGPTVQALTMRVRQFTGELAPGAPVFAVAAKAGDSVEANAALATLRGWVEGLLHGPRQRQAEAGAAARVDDVLAATAEGARLALRIAQETAEGREREQSRLRDEAARATAELESRRSEWVSAAQSAGNEVRREVLQRTAQAADEVVSALLEHGANEDNRPVVHAHLRTLFTEAAAAGSEHTRTRLAEAAERMRSGVSRITLQSGGDASPSYPLERSEARRGGAFTPLSATAGLGVMALAIVATPLVPAAVLLVGLFAFGAVRGIEAAHESSQSALARSTRAEVKDGLHRLDTVLRQVADSTADELWSGMAEGIHARLATARHTASAADSPPDAERVTQLSASIILVEELRRKLRLVMLDAAEPA